jgi:hypothetical protein
MSVGIYLKKYLVNVLSVKILSLKEQCIVSEYKYNYCTAYNFSYSDTGNNLTKNIMITYRTSTTNTHNFQSSFSNDRLHAVSDSSF